MMRKILLATIILGGVAWGQAGTTTVTALVQDVRGSFYVNCQWSAVFVGQNTNPGAGPYQPDAYTVGKQGNCDSFGNLTVQLADNINTITPTPSQWNFSICSAQGYVAGPYCRANMLVTITGASQDLTSFFIPLMPILPPFGAGNGTFIPPAQQWALTVYGGAGISNTLFGVPVPLSAVNGVPLIPTEVPLAGVATQEQWQPGGVVPRPATCPSNVDTVLNTDRIGYVSWNDSSACTVTLPQAGTAGFASNYAMVGCDIGAGTATITPTTSTISYTTGVGYTSAASSMPLTTGQCAFIYSDNSNYIGLTIGTGISVSGTTNRIAKFTSSTAVGNSQVTDDGTHAATSPNGLGLGTTGGVTFDKVNDTSTGTTANLFVCKSSTAGSVVTCPTSTTTGVLGVAVAGVGTAPGTSGSTSVCYSGVCSVIMDNTSVIGDYCIPSVTTAGRCHDSGSVTVPSGVMGFFVLSVATVGNAAKVEILTPDWYSQNTPVIPHGITFDIACSGGLVTTSLDVCATSGYITVPFACTIQAYNLAIDAGTITVKFLKVAPGTAIPTIGSNSISTSGVGISSGTAIHSTTLSDFTSTAVAQNSIMAMVVTAVGTAKQVTGVLACQ